MYEGFHLRITTDPEEKLVIPDPAEVSGVAEVTLFQNNKDLDIGNLKGSALNRQKTYADNLPFVSLPFLGLDGTAIVTNYAVGTIGEEKPQEITVDYEYSRKGEKQSATKTVKGNCLVLTLWQINDEENRYEHGDGGYAYLVVLDYENRTSYKIETGIFKGKQDQLNLCDITGDGQDEMIVSGVANKWLVWQMFQLSDGEWKEIKSDYYGDENETNGDASNYIPRAFDAKFINDSTVEVWCKDKNVNFKKEIDAADIVEEVKAEGLHWEEAYVDDEKIYGYSIFQNVDPEAGICYDLDVVVCHGWLCGKIKAYLKYDKKTGKLKISEVKFKMARDEE